MMEFANWVKRASRSSKCAAACDLHCDLCLPCCTACIFLGWPTLPYLQQCCGVAPCSTTGSVQWCCTGAVPPWATATVICRTIMVLWLFCGEVGCLWTALCCTVWCCCFHQCVVLYGAALDCTELHWVALDWTGLDWTGLHWTALDWTALDCTCVGVVCMCGWCSAL